ncbi:MAG: anaerobic ribonucleoside-triphosphate reductase activating protein [Pseudomonadota bacterium]
MPEPEPGRAAREGAGQGLPAGLADLAAGYPPLKGFLETSFLDWRGSIASVLFLPGCNFACPYCHNHQLAAEPDSLMDLPLEDVLARLKPFVGWVDGVVISGGEPTLHPGLAGLCQRLKDAGFAVKLDTNGHRPEVIEQLTGRGLIDMVAMDLKAPLNDLAYRRAAGKPVDLERIRRSIALLVNSGLAHEFRSTIWPAWHGPEELAAMAGAVEGAQAWTLQALRPESAWDQEALGAGRPYTPQELSQLQKTHADAVAPRG